MSQLFGFVSFILNIYMMIVFFRIILTWFSGFGTGGIQNVLSKITDPYLNWFKRFSFLKFGFLDLSPIVALGALSLANRILIMLARYGRISIGIILALLLQAVWGAVSFFLGFLIVILVLQLIAYLFVKNTYSPFWRIIDSISQPILHKITGLFFRNRITNFIVTLVTSIAGMLLIYFLFRTFIGIVTMVLVRLPF
jgi:YggT family protein